MLIKISSFIAGLIVSKAVAKMDLSFNLPFCLLLPDGEYPVRLSDGKVVRLLLEMKIPETYDEKIGIRGITKKDLEGVSTVHVFITENEYAGDRGQVIPAEKIWEMKEVAHVSVFHYADGREAVPETPIYINSEIPKDRQGRFRYTKLTIVEEQSVDLKKLALLAVNRLIDYYRFLTGEHWIQHVTASDVIAYTSKDGGGGYGPTIKRRRLHDDFTVRSLREKLTGNKSPATFDMMRLDAKAAIDQENYALAIIYSMTSLESLVKTYFRLYGSRMLYTSSTIETLENMTLFHAVCVVLRLVFPKEELGDALITEFKRINRIRNDIIHQAVIDANLDDAKKAVEMIDSFYDILVPEILAGHARETQASTKG